MYIGVWCRLKAGKGKNCAGFSLVHSPPSNEKETTDGFAPAPPVIPSPGLFPTLDPLICPHQMLVLPLEYFSAAFLPLHS